MTRIQIKSLTGALIAWLLIFPIPPGMAAGSAAAQWSQWGGPTQDFKIESKGLADSWPDQGPPELWNRDLGEGYSAIVADDDHLYTMYRKDGKEIVIALEAATGKTTWEHAYVETPDPSHTSSFGNGPRATPAISAGRIFTIGVAGQMYCLDKNTGLEIWSHDLWRKFEYTFHGHGYSSSPFIYKNTVIVLLGGRGNSIIAFNQNDGSVAWKKHDYRNSYSVPRLITVDGQVQLLCFMANELISINPNNGTLYWTYEVGNQWGHNISQPTFDDDDNMLLLSSTYVGSHGLKLTPTGKKCKVEEVWRVSKVQFYHVTTVALDDYVYGSHGNGMGQVSLYTCINRKTGEIAWRKRGLGKSNTLYADGKFIILDEDGELALARANPDKFEIVSQTKIFGRPAWTVPTLVGTTLYLRDNNTLIALDLS